MRPLTVGAEIAMLVRPKANTYVQVLTSSIRQRQALIGGDALLGERVNVGAGTITANYDGKNKHVTEIGSGSKTGANSVLVAPIKLGEQVTVAAGSTLTKDVPDGALGLARARQLVKQNWTGP